MEKGNRKIRGKGSMTGFALAAMAMTAAPAIADGKEPVGFVERKKGAAGTEVWIERGGEKLRAAPGTALLPGDVVVVRGQGNYAALLIAGVRGVAKVGAGRSFTVPAPREQDWFARFSGLISSIGDALTLTDREARTNTASRSAGEEGEASGAEALSPVPALDASSLYAARELGTLALRWCGEAQTVEVSNADNLLPDAKADVSGFGISDISEFIEVEGDEEYPADLVTVRAVTGENLEYPIKWIAMDEVPKPKELGDWGGIDAPDKVLWAQWLIEDEDGTLGNQYNLIAFSLLREVRDEIWVAGYLLEKASYCPAGSAAID